jgi:hypothetical protein
VPLPKYSVPTLASKATASGGGETLSTLKNFNMPAEGHTLQFRFEAFNLPNHTNWGNPDANAGQIVRNAAGQITNAGSFGVLTGTRTNMRQLQFALKYIF